VTASTYAEAGDPLERPTFPVEAEADEAHVEHDRVSHYPGETGGGVSD